MKDLIISKLIKKEIRREADTLNLIASENYASLSVLEALGSIFTNKYAEGYPGSRYYPGCEVFDEVEKIAQKRALKLFGLSSTKWSVNVQALSGSAANLAVYLALVPPGEKIMGLELRMGGHFTHGHKASASGKLWRPLQYVLNPETETLDYRSVEEIAKREYPKIIIAGYSAYSRLIDWKKLGDIAKKVGAVFMADMSHLAGLVAGKTFPSPFPYADIVTTTTHKTLRGPRSALIFSRKEYAELIDKAVFPGLQGGPHGNQIAAVGVALLEAGRPAFRKYAKQIVANAQILATELARRGWRIVSGGTDTHLFLINTFACGVSGREAKDLLEKVGVVANQNMIPFDPRTPRDPSGIRIGTPAVTTRGMKEKEMQEIAALIDATLLKKKSMRTLQVEVSKILKKFPLWY